MKTIPQIARQQCMTDAVTAMFAKNRGSQLVAYNRLGLPMYDKIAYSLLQKRCSGGWYGGYGCNGDSCGTGTCG